MSFYEKNIILESKIIAILDTFSALVTNRPYRNGVKYENASEIIKYFSLCISIKYD